MSTSYLNNLFGPVSEGVASMLSHPNLQDVDGYSHMRDFIEAEYEFGHIFKLDDPFPETDHSMFLIGPATFGFSTEEGLIYDFNIVGNLNGSNYLSNEIFYRITRAREKLDPSIKTGHYHIANTNPSGTPLGVSAFTMTEILNEVEDMVKRSLSDL